MFLKQDCASYTVCHSTYGGRTWQGTGTPRMWMTLLHDRYAVYLFSTIFWIIFQ